MKKIAVLVSLLLCNYAESQGWSWGVGSTSGTVTEAFRLAADHNGHLYMTGMTGSNPFVFGNDTLYGYADDLLVSRVDVNGTIQWTKRIGGNGMEWISDIDTDDSGYVYVGATFGSASVLVGSTTLNNNGFNDLMLIKMDSLGNVIWARSAGGTNDERCYGLGVDGEGNCYVTGLFSSSSMMIGSTTLTNSASGSCDIFLARYDRNGNPIWAKKAGGSSFDIGYDVEADAFGNAFFTAHYQSPTCTLGTFTLTNGGSCNSYLAKIDSSGTIEWIRTASPSTIPNITASNVAVDAWGNPYITGSFYSQSVMLGNVTLNNTSPSGNHYDYFIAKYDSIGNLRWAQSNGELNDDYGYDLSTDLFGNVYAVGGFPVNSGIVFGTFILVPPAQVDPMFIVQYDTSGTILCANAFRTGGDDQNAVTTDDEGNVYIFGDFYSSSFIMGNDTLAHPNGEDLFVGKYLCDITTDLIVKETEHSSNIHPNPNNGKFIVTRATLNSLEEFELRNVVGQLVFSRGLSQDETEMDVSSLQDGVYFCVLRENNGIETVSKMIIRH